MGKQSKKKIATDGSVESEPETSAVNEDADPGAPAPDAASRRAEIIRKLAELEAEKKRVDQEHLESHEAMAGLRLCRFSGRNYEKMERPVTVADLEVETPDARKTRSDRNLEYCREWYRTCWVPSIPAIKKVLPAETISKLHLRDASAEEIQPIFLRAVESTDLEADEEEIVADLAALRFYVYPSRWKLQDYFGFLEGQVPWTPTVRQWEREATRRAEQERRGGEGESPPEWLTSRNLSPEQQRVVLDAARKLEADGREWIPRSVLKTDFGIKAKSVDTAAGKRRGLNVKRGGAPSMEPVAFVRTFLLDFVRLRWKPRISK